MNFINRYCRIQKKSLIQQGRKVFTSTDTTLDEFLGELYNYFSLSYPKFYKMDRLSKLGFLASEVLVKDKPFFPSYAPDQVAVVLSNATSSLDTDIRFAESMKTIPSPALFVYTLPNVVAGEICIRHGITGENAFFVSAKFDAEQMADYVTIVMAGKTRACIAGWVDVMGDSYDVFLYLVEKEKTSEGVNHTPSQLQKIYTKDYGTTNR